MFAVKFVLSLHFSGLFLLRLAFLASQTNLNTQRGPLSSYSTLPFQCALFLDSAFVSPLFSTSPSPQTSWALNLAFFAAASHILDDGDC